MAGDLWTGTKFIEWAGFSWIGKVAPRFKKVLIVLGNHDLWPQGDLSIKNGADKCNAMLQDMGYYNVQVLDMSTYASGDYLFVGCTLWTDMNKSDPLTMHNMPTFMNYDGKIAYETGLNGAWSRFTSEKWVSIHWKHRDYIKHVAAQNRDKKIIVITHHLPLPGLGDPNFIGNQGNYYYSSDLSELILDNENIKYWFCGHSHVSNDILFPAYAGEDGCRMYMNPVGYLSEHREQESLVKHEVLDI